MYYSFQRPIIYPLIEHNNLNSLFQKTHVSQQQITTEIREGPNKGYQEYTHSSTFVQ